jgi:hypothetical protein
MLIKLYLLQSSAAIAPTITPAIEMIAMGIPTWPVLQATMTLLTLLLITAMLFLNTEPPVDFTNADELFDALPDGVCCLIVSLSLAYYNELY